MEVEMTVFRSILRHIIGSYELIPDDIIEAKFAEIQEILIPKKRNIIETFIKVMKIKEEFVNLEDLKANFKANEIKMDRSNLDVIMVKLYKETGNADRLPYKMLFE